VEVTTTALPTNTTKEQQSTQKPKEIYTYAGVIALVVIVIIALWVAFGMGRKGVKVQQQTHKAHEVNKSTTAKDTYTEHHTSHSEDIINPYRPPSSYPHPSEQQQSQTQPANSSQHEHTPEHNIQHPKHDMSQPINKQQNDQNQTSTSQPTNQSEQNDQQQGNTP
jgi:hypothetical protein